MIKGFDHVAVTVADLDATCRFYAEALGARIEESYEIDGRLVARRVAVGGAILNVHQRGNGLDLVARRPTPGSADICLRWDGPIEDARQLLQARSITIVEGPVERVSADGKPAVSIYFHDPDGNLIELLAA